MKKILLQLLLLAAVLPLSSQKLTVTYVTPSIVRVQWALNECVTDNATGVCVYQPQDVKVRKQERADRTI